MAKTPFELRNEVLAQRVVKNYFAMKYWHSAL